MASTQHKLYDDFEHIYKHSYSHGLEKIYALENVDIRSIRKIDSTPATTKITPSNKAKKSVTPAIEQLELPFGFPFQKANEPFIYREPFTVLGLSKRIETILVGLGKSTIGDLLDEARESIVQLPGLGQGHVDEVRLKLTSYLAEHDSCNVKLDLNSWLKTLFGDLAPRKGAVLLEEYGLPPLLSLTATDSAEVRKLSPQNRSMYIDEALIECRSSTKEELLHTDMQDIAELHLVPWMQKRAGIATLDQLYEYLYKLSGMNPSFVEALELISKVYFKGNFPFKKYLAPVEDDLYCCNHEIASYYFKVVETAYSYFYKEDLCYSLESLVGLMSRELASRWEGFDEPFIENVLRLSCRFRVRKAPSGSLTVKLS